MALKRSHSAKSKTSPVASSPSIGPASPVTETFANLPAQGLLPMELALMLSAEVSPARISASPGLARDLLASAAGCFTKSPALLANWDQDTLSWKTSARCFLEGWMRFSEPWPRSGMMRNGTAYQLAPLVPLIGVIGSGLLPTPRAMDSRGAQGATKTETLVRRMKSGFGANLPEAAQLMERGLWPTPSASMSKGSSPASLTRKNGRDRSKDRLDHAVMASQGGALNPTWVEWLMGFPTGHTDLNPSETPSSPKSPN